MAGDYFSINIVGFFLLHFLFSYSRESVLTQQLSQRFHQLEKGIRLKILDQPSDQHRARYSSEGSRGAVKDTTGDGSPRIQVNK